jgi:hypothetical protein
MFLSKNYTNEKLHNLYSLPSSYYPGDQIKNNEMGVRRVAYTVLAWRHEGKRPLGRPTRGGEDNIKMDLREKVWEAVDWILLAQDRDKWRAVVNTVMNLSAP